MKRLLLAMLLLAPIQSIAAASDRPGRQDAAGAGVDGGQCTQQRSPSTSGGERLRGRAVFRSYCVLCHGAEGRGDGRGASRLTPAPANLVASRVPRDYLALIIRQGGTAVGRSEAMPAWGEQLTGEQMCEVVDYLLSIRR